MSSDWYYSSGANEVGPLPFKALVQMARQGRLTADSFVRQGQRGAWLQANNVPNLLPPSAKTTNRLPHSAQASSRPPPLAETTSDFPAPVRPQFAQRRRFDESRTLIMYGTLAAGLFIVFAMIIASTSRQPSSKAAVPAQAPISAAPVTPVVKPSTSGNWMERAAVAAKCSVVQVQTSTGLGTGFVIASRRERHLVLTNRHVVETASFFGSPTMVTKCLVKLESGTTNSARLAGSAVEEAVDLALLLVESPELQPLGRLADFDNVNVGQQVVAIGNPGIKNITFENSLTQGIVSGKREDLYLQTSAAINHGNSGGPLVNESGEVVGVNTYSLGSAGVQGIGLAIRADIVRSTGRWQFKIDVSDLLAAIP